MGNKQDSEQFGKKLKATILPPKGQLSIADAATQSGLSLSDAKNGLMFLVSEHRGHLAATSTGELLFSFPHGFSRPWIKVEKSELLWKKTKKVSIGIAKFVARAWITVVMVGYVVIFAAILIAMLFANKNSDRDDGGSFGGSFMFYFLFRAIMDSLFWTFHPFSPFAVQHSYDHDPRHYYDRGHGRQNKKPFYEKVNNFFFGPEIPEEDPLAKNRAILAEIRAKQGYIGLFDVMRVTGLERGAAESMLTKLMLDYEGDVQVSNAGGITYTFPELLKSAEISKYERPRSIWEKKEKLPKLTGDNTGGSNFLIFGLNAFNFVMSLVAIGGGWTIEKLFYIYENTQSGLPEIMWPAAPVGTPLALGWVPFWFSLVLFSFPALRLLFRGKAADMVNRENGRRGLLKAILTKLTPRGIREKILRNYWEAAADTKPRKSEMTREIVKLGGDLEISDAGEANYRFAELESETQALESDRATQTEAHKIGEVVFSSSN